MSLMEADNWLKGFTAWFDWNAAILNSKGPLTKWVLLENLQLHGKRKTAFETADRQFNHNGHTTHWDFLPNFFFTQLSYHPGGCHGCPEKGTRNYNLFVRSAVFQPKWNAVQKTYKNHQNPVKSHWFFLDIFRVCSILAEKQRPKPIK